MKPLSEQLTDLAARAKKTEDFVTTAQEHNRTKLETEQAKLKASITEGNARAEQQIATLKGGVKASWSESRSSVDQWFTKMRAEADDRRTVRSIKKAEHNAEVAERDAADAIDLALYVLDQAEYAVVDAAIARADADDLAATQ